MSERPDRVKMARPGEPDVVKTTIVGGQPPREGRSIGDVPRGVEVLIKKAAVDPAFKKTLLAKRARAADDIALKLEPVEAAMLDAVPEGQLRATIGRTKVSPNLRPAFLGAAAAAMLAALAAAGCKHTASDNTRYPAPPTGINPDIPKTAETAAEAPETAATAVEEPETGAVETGIRPDLPPTEGE
jgi:hypothetical protein